MKLKEISYIHAEGYPAGEMKHGPIALLDAHTPVVVLAPHDRLYIKTMNNLLEVKAREAPIIALGTEGDQEIGHMADVVFVISDVPRLFYPVTGVGLSGIRAPWPQYGPSQKFDQKCDG